MAIVKTMWAWGKRQREVQGDDERDVGGGARRTGTGRIINMWIQDAVFSPHSSQHTQRFASMARIESAIKDKR